jgi:superoxide dismutase, Fe-Mn family
MDRKRFITDSLIIGGASILASNSALAFNVKNNGIDNLISADNKFSLSALPYSESYLEPYMDAETLHLHYTFHHGGAVTGANKDMEKIKAALDKGELDAVDFWTKKLSYHFSSHLLHTIFWTNLGNKRTEPKGDLLRHIDKSFGSFDKLKAYISETAKNVDGNGWGVLVWQPYSNSLSIIQCENHEKLIQWGAVPLLVIDVWEHAYYLKYKNKRGDFVDALFNIINWDNVAERLNFCINSK